MISVIISSAKKELLKQVSKNIADTIAVEYEIIAFDNSDGSKGICEIYNLGIAQARYDILCFMHEDVLMKTADWGRVVLNIFEQNPDLGLIGIAGSSYRPLSPCAWNGHGSKNYYLNVLQHYKHAGEPTVLTYHNPGNKKLGPVVTVDGVWFCTTKAVVAKCRFDESIKGFHGYDVDFSLSVGQQKKVAVTFDVLLEHFSDGKVEANWIKNTVQIYDKWYQLFPIMIEPLTKAEQIFIERKTFKHFISLIVNNGLSLTLANRALWKDGKLLKLSFGLFLKLQFYIFKAWVRRALALKAK